MANRHPFRLRDERRFVLRDEATGPSREYLQVVNAQRLWPLARRHWFDGLVLVGHAIGLAESTVRQGDRGGPEGPLWFDLLAVLATVLPLFARRRFPFGVPVAVGAAIAAISFVDHKFMASLIPILVGLATFVLLALGEWRTVTRSA